MAVYLGNSPDHAVNAPLVLNTRSGLVSPQYHVVFDDSFTTAKRLHTDKLPENWLTLFKDLESSIAPSKEPSTPYLLIGKILLSLVLALSTLLMSRIKLWMLLLWFLHWSPLLSPLL